MDTITVTPKQIRQIVQATFPDYKRREARIVLATSVTFRGLNWDGGSRTQYRACRLDGMPAPRQPDMSARPPWDNPLEGATVELPPGVAIVESGTFCGKTAMMYVHVHPDSLAKLLPDKQIQNAS